MANIQCRYVLPDGTRHEFIRAGEDAFTFEQDGVIHANTMKGGSWRPEYEARAGEAAGRELIWCIEQIGDDGRTVWLSEKRMTLSAYSGASFTLRPA